MPPKRKALASADPNVAIEAPATKKTKGKKTTDASSSSTAATAPKYKYSNPDALEKDLPDLIAICWPKDSDSSGDEEEQEEPAAKDDATPIPREVNAKAWPVTRTGFNKFVSLTEEQRKRDPDCHGLYIYNDFAGYGCIEVLENFLEDFNKVIFKKNISPLEKWAFMEAIVLFLQIGDLMPLMMNDTPSIASIFNILPKLLIVSLEMLSEHSLASPNPALPSVGVMTLMLIEFLTHDATDYEIRGVKEIVRAADQYGVDLSVRKELKIKEDEVRDLLELCRSGRKSKMVSWRSEWTRFSYHHPGGTRYDITKMCKAEKEKYKLGRGFSP